jgi:hypothetical protein
VARNTPVLPGVNARTAAMADDHPGVYKGPGFLDRVVNRPNAVELNSF